MCFWITNQDFFNAHFIQELCLTSPLCRGVYNVQWTEELGQIVHYGEKGVLLDTADPWLPLLPAPPLSRPEGEGQSETKQFRVTITKKNKATFYTKVGYQPFLSEHLNKGKTVNLFCFEFYERFFLHFEIYRWKTFLKKNHASFPWIAIILEICASYFKTQTIKWLL